MLVIISFKYIFKFFMCGHAWVNFRVLTRWKCFTQNTIFKLILKIYEFSLKLHAKKIQHYYMYIMIPVCMLSALINPLLDPLLDKYQYFQFNISRFDVHQGYNGLIVIDQLTHCYTEAIVFYVGSRTDI